MPNDTLLYSDIIFLLCHQQQQMRTKRETYSQTLLRVRDLGTLSPKRDVSIKSPLRAQGTPWKRKKECVIQRGCRASRKQFEQEINVSKAHLNSQISTQQKQGLHRPSALTALSLEVLWDSWVSDSCGLSCLFSFCWSLMWNFLIFLIIFKKKKNECKHSYLSKG